MANVVIAIDGPSGSGKSSTSRSIALRAHWKYLDTGALYRAITWLALEENRTEASDIVEAAKFHEISFIADPENPKVFLGDRDLSQEIRSARVTDNVSQISQMPEIRAYLVEMQRKIIEDSPTGIVVEGRDIGTVVAPDAQLKIFLYASRIE